MLRREISIQRTTSAALFVVATRTKTIGNVGVRWPAEKPGARYNSDQPWTTAKNKSSMKKVKFQLWTLDHRKGAAKDQKLGHGNLHGNEAEPGQDHTWSSMPADAVFSGPQIGFWPWTLRREVTKYAIMFSVTFWIFIRPWVSQSPAAGRTCSDEWLAPSRKLMKNFEMQDHHYLGLGEGMWETTLFHYWAVQQNKDFLDSLEPGQAEKFKATLHKG